MPEGMITLGRTGLEVNPAGLGGGGPSQLGQRTDTSEADSVRLVERAIELGVNFFDTAESYRTETVIGKAVRGRPRERFVVATKASPWHGTWRQPDRLISPAELNQAIEGSLRRLGLDYVDIYQLHALPAGLYRQAVETLVPVMGKLRDQGKLRFVGVTEEFIFDPGHEMLQLAVRDDCWDTMMVGFNLLNPSARHRVLPLTRAKNIGTLIMFAVRRALSRPDSLRAVLDQLVAAGRLDADRLDRDDPLGFLTSPGVAGSLPEVAYRFCRHEPGCDVILFGTGRVEHLEANVRSLHAGPLPAATLARLEELFGQVDSVSGN